METSGRYAVKIKELSARLEEMLEAQAEYSSGYCVDKGWKAEVERFLDEKKLTKEMVEAFVDKAMVHEDGSIEVHLKYDRELEGLLRLRAGREAV